MSIVGTISAENGNLIGTLSHLDEFNPTLDFTFKDDYQLVDVVVGQLISIELISEEYDPFLQLIDADTGEVIAKNDNFNWNTSNSGLSFVAAENTNYIVRVSGDAFESSSYELSTASTVVGGDGYGGDGYGGGGDGYGGDGYGGDGYGGDGYGGDGYGGDGYGGDGYGGDGYGGDGYGGDGYGGDGYGGDGYGGDGYGGDEGVDLSIDVENINAPESLSVHSKADVSLIVDNIGNAPAFDNYWDHLIVLSKDKFVSNDDVYVGNGEWQNSHWILQTLSGQPSLLPGDSYDISSEISISNVEAGSYYLLFTVNRFGNLPERDLDNNVTAVPIEINGTDVNLDITTANAPSEIVEDERVIDISWTVSNKGTEVADTDRSWRDQVYFSDDEIFDSGDPEIGDGFLFDESLASGASYTVEQSITLPYWAKAGSYYLFFLTDQYNNQYETDETDNVTSLPLEILTPDINLAVTNIPDSLQTNAQNNFYVSATVTNIGSETTKNNSFWYDRVYWSTDEIYDSSDIELDSAYVGGSTTPLAPGDTYTKHYDFDVPDVEAGSYYLLYYIDLDNNQQERNETDNVTSIAIEVAPSPNLAITSTNISGSNIAGNRIDLSWTVANLGDAIALQEYWYDEVYLSEDEYIDENDTYIEYYEAEDLTLAPGEEYIASQAVYIPNVEAKNYYLLFHTDAGESQGETNETDNVKVVPFEISAPANLVVSDAVAPTQVDSNYSIPISWIVSNTGEVSTSGKNWFDRVYLSKDEAYDDDDLEVASGRRGYYSYSSNPNARLGAGESYSVERNITLDNNTELGNYYLLFITDDSSGYYYEPYGDYGYGRQAETDETDNVKVVPIEVIQSDADLNITPGTVTATAKINDTITVDWTVTNDGTDPALANSWQDKVYVSDDEYLDESDLEIDYQLNEFETYLAAGGSYTNERDIYLSNKVEAGNKYLLFVTDSDKEQIETDETNNVKAIPISLNIPDVDLSLTVNTSPASAIVQSEPTITWTVTNKGTEAPLATSWRDYIYISDDEIYDEGEDRYVGYSYYNNEVVLEAGQSYTKSRTIDIPQTKTGERYLLFVSDFKDTQADTDITNDTVAVPINIKAPNLEVYDIVTPTKGNKESTDIGVSWNVKNDGNAITLASSWYDGVYFSTDAIYDDSDVRLTQNQKTTYRRYNGRVKGRVSPGESYSNTGYIDIPDADPGDYYLLFTTDTSKDQGETNEVDNTIAIPFEVLDTTNIVAATATAPSQGTLNDYIDVSWTVTNTGSSTASATWEDFVYLSEDEIYDSSDVYVGRQQQEIDTFLVTGESYTANDRLKIPKAAGIGDRYLLFVADARKDFVETNETDNVYALPIELNAPNLTVTDANPPSAVSFNEILDVSWTVTNTGESRAAGNTAGKWYDYIYLSDDAVHDDNDTYLNQLELVEQIPLAAGESYLASQSIKIPRTVEAGNKYILFVADKSNVQGETDETDNTLALPIEIKSPDLEFDLDLMSVTAEVSANQTLNLSWTVNNTGDGTAYRDVNSYWRDYIYISDDAIYDSSDQNLIYQDIIEPVESGGSYTFEVNAKLKDERIGSQYILFVLDKNDVEKESDETNNVYAAPINIQTSNLEISGVNSPAEAVLNQQISLSWTTTNTGAGDAFAPKSDSYSWDEPWRDLVYLSKDEVVDDNDPILTNQYNYSHNKYNLASSESYTLSDNVYIPDTEAGEYYLLFATDAYGVLVEGNESDNVYSQPITIGATNLEVIAVDAPTSLILNQTIDASWTVSNTGNVTAPAEWKDYIYISDDPYYDNHDVYVAARETGDRTPLAGGDSYTFTEELVIPDTAIGDRYLLFIADGNKRQGENNETDNTYALPIHIAAPNLSISNPQAPGSVYLGESVDIAWKLNNTGEVSAPKSGYDFVYISDDPYFDDNDPNLISQNTGNFANLGSNNSYTIEKDVVIPRTTLGARYLLFVADGNNKQGETDETDNVLAVPIEITALDVDLVVSNISAPLESFAGDEVEVVWTVTNTGSDDATGTWTDRIYLAQDTTNIQANEIYGSFEFTGTIAAGESIERRQKITLPPTLEGDFQLVVTTDVDDELIEYGKENNNTTARAEQFKSILPTFANLQVTSVIAPNTTFSSQSTVVEWTVTNVGDAATSAPSWQDSIWLSLDQTYDGADISLGKVANTSYLNPGESYTNSLEIDLPQGIDGNYYFLVETDSDTSQVFEFQNEDDNFGVSNISDIELTPPPDLQVSVNAPSNAFSSEFANLSWTVTNEGTGRTLQSTWYDEVFLSTDEILDGSDESLGRRTHRGALEPGESYTKSDINNRFRLPEGISGEYYFIVRTDAGGEVYESALAANNTSFDETPTTVFLTPPPDLEISVNAPDTALASHDLTIQYNTANYGATSTPDGKWVNTFYLSADDQLDNSDIILGNRTTYEFTATESYTDKSATFVLPDGINGNYYLFAKADSNDAVFELDKDNNIAFDTITIESQPADLVVSALTASNIVEAGTAAKVSWTITNQGAGDTVKARWKDELWLSLDSAIGNSDDRLLETFYHNSLLDAGESYTNEELVTIPFDFEGDYRLYAKTDAEDSVYEANAEDNNASLLSPITVTRETPDLQATLLSTPVVGTSGESFFVEWSVVNSGTGKTNSNYWYDEVFLSLDQNLNYGLKGNDISLGKVHHSGLIEANEAYQVSHTFNLPQNLEGDYYVIVRTDISNQVLETSSENNDAVSSSIANISLNTVADLIISSIDVPTQAISGQTFDVEWTVSNQGADVARSWTDVFYLSQDQVFDRDNDIYLGSRFNYDNLATGAEYTKTASFEISRGLSGRFYVFGITDSNNTTYEREGENNNIAFDGNSINVILPPPVDLVAEVVNVPTDGTPGQNITLDYTVTNEGDYTVDGNWEDAIYLSEDDQWDIDDRLIKKVRVFDSVESGESYSRTVNADLPGVASGDYHVIIRSDIRDGVSESDETNNLAVSTEQINVDIPVIEIDVPVSDSFNLGNAIYYRLDVPEGETILLNLNSNSDTASNELYVRYGDMPSRSEFDYNHSEPFVADQQVVIPSTQAGSYYILAYNDSNIGFNSSFSLKADILDFEVRSISTHEGGNSGNVTVVVEGAKFDSATEMLLVDEASGFELAASSIQ
ncbi:MAG: CARDB domain-containing protein, partial [Cyanobacteria bacterium J06631_2]